MRTNKQVRNLLPVGTFARSKLTGWACEILAHVRRHEGGAQYRVRWLQNGFVGYARPSAVERIS